MRPEPVKGVEELMESLPEGTALQELGRPLFAFIVREMLADNKRLQAAEEWLGLPYRTRLVYDWQEGE